MSECTCPLAGWCERHSVAKGNHWHSLCQRREDYRKAWDAGSGPGQNKLLPQRRPSSNPGTSEMWKSLHSYAVENAYSWSSSEGGKWLRVFSSKVPSYGCSCKSNWKAYMTANKPPLGSAKEFFEWGVIAHNYVSTHHASPRKPEMAMADAYKLYDAPWPLQDNARQIL
jgi:hypothetical protein